MTTTELLAAELKRRGHTVTAGGMTCIGGAAAVLGTSTKTLRNWRSAGRGPITVKIAGKVWFPLEKLADFLDSGYRGISRDTPGN